MAADAVVINLEIAQLACQIDCIPEQQPIKILTPDGADDPLDKRVRSGDIGNRFDLLDLRTRRLASQR